MSTDKSTGSWTPFLAKKRGRKISIVYVLSIIQMLLSLLIARDRRLLWITCVVIIDNFFMIIGSTEFPETKYANFILVEKVKSAWSIS